MSNSQSICGPFNYLITNLDINLFSRGIKFMNDSHI